MKKILIAVMMMVSTGASAYNVQVVDESKTYKTIGSSQIRQHCIDGKTYMVVGDRKMGINIIQVFTNDGKGNSLPQQCHPKR